MKKGYGRSYGYDKKEITKTDLAVEDLKEAIKEEILDKIYKTAFIEHLTTEQRKELRSCFK